MDMGMGSIWKSETREGIPLRDLFAAFALAGMCAADGDWGCGHMEKEAYFRADAMLDARKQGASE